MLAASVKLYVASSALLRWPGSNKELSGCPEQVDSPSGQVPFHSYFPDEQEISQVVYQLNYKKSKLKLAQGKQYLTNNYPKDNLKLFRALHGVINWIW